MSTGVKALLHPRSLSQREREDKHSFSRREKGWG
jgi:hypothetical protein